MNPSRWFQTVSQLRDSILAVESQHRIVAMLVCHDPGQDEGCGCRCATAEELVAALKGERDSLRVENVQLRGQPDAPVVVDVRPPASEYERVCAEAVKYTLSPDEMHARRMAFVRQIVGEGR